jgi:hypothetical protein
MKKALASLIAAAFSLAAVPSQATVYGYMDYIYFSVGGDIVYGWVCDSAAPYSYAGSILVYQGGPAGSGTLMADDALANVGGKYRPDVPAGGYCSGNQYAGWTVLRWLDLYSWPIYVYYRDPNTLALTLLSNTPKTCYPPTPC